MSKAGFVPNSFQTPNGYVDDAMSFLSGDEFKVLIYATRRILGFQKRQDRISLSQFTDGTKNKEGEILDSGTGLSVDTVKKCLSSLVAFGLMVRIEENDPHANEGVLWGLQWDDNKVNWQALSDRDAEKSKADAEKMAKVRSMRQPPPLYDIPPLVTQNAPPLVTQTHPPPCGIETQNTEEIQGNPASRGAGISREWDMLHGVALQEEDEEAEFLRLAVDAANMIATGKPARYDFALKFILGVHKIPTESQIKNWRKGIDEWLSFKPKQPTPEDVSQAISEYMGRNLTIATPYSLSNLYTIANPPNGHAAPAVDIYDEPWRKETWREQTVK